VKKIYAILVSFSLLIGACAPVDFSKPLIEWPQVCDVTTGVCYEVVIMEKPGVPGAMPGTQYITEYIPVAPLSSQETLDSLATIGYTPFDQIIMMVLPSSWTKEDGTTVDIQMAGGAAIATMAKSDPRLCTAIGMHVIEKIGGQISWPIMIAAFDGLANNTIAPDVIRIGGGKTVVQFVFQNTKWILLFADSSSPTVLVPVVGNMLGKFAGATKALPLLGQGQALGVMAEISYFFKCVKNSWPKNAEEAEQARRDHNSAYNKRKVRAVPDDFPMPLPIRDASGNMTTVMVQVSVGDFSNMEALELDVLIGLGVIALAVTTPLPELALAGGGAGTLQWASQFAH